jgi:hypothetical protein
MKNHFDADNRRAAWIILSDPARYGGLPLAWAKLWLERHPEATDEQAHWKTARREPGSAGWSLAPPGGQPGRILNAKKIGA